MGPWRQRFRLFFRLLHYKVRIPKVELCRSSVFHFEHYLSQAGDDVSDADQIRGVITDLRSRLDQYASLDAVRNMFDDDLWWGSLKSKYIEQSVQAFPKSG